MNKAFNKVIKSHVVLAVLSLFAVVLLSAGVTYSLFQIDRRNTTNQKVEVGTLSGAITSIQGGIVVNDLYPEKASEITDEDKKYNFTITNDGTYDLKYEVYLKDATDILLSTTTEYNSYKRISSNHYQYINFKLDGDTAKNLASIQSGDKFILLSGTIKAGTSQDHSLQFFLDNQDTTTTGAPNDIAGSVISLDIYFDGTAEEEETIVDKIAQTSNGVRTSFDDPATTDEGIYAMEDDYGTSYYYRGAVTNNYVKFGRNASGQDMYWRIIRINGDGSLRIIYTGTQAYANGTNSSDMFIGASGFNPPNYDDVKYVGYMYGPAGTTASTSKEEAQTNTESSTIKTYIDNWYKTNIVDTGYSDAVADILFCNDRSTPGKTATGLSDDTGLGYGKNYTAFGGYARIGASSSPNYNDPKPTLKCPQKNDAFTVSDTNKGNGALTYPVGLITADEVVAAGSGKYGTYNSNYYLYRPGNWWWTLSPSVVLTNGYPCLFNVGGPGYLGEYSTDYTEGTIAPVINLSAEYVETLKGSGTASDPYVA